VVLERPRMPMVAELYSGYQEWQLPESPYAGFYAFNPSVHWDGERWRCAVRHQNYRPGCFQVAGGRIHTQNTLLELRPGSGGRLEIEAEFDMLEVDGLRRYHASETGFEDLRLFKTERDGLVAIATTSQLREEREQEMALLYLDKAYRIAHVEPLRGGSWTRTPQKNWSPFDGAFDMKFVYAIEESSFIERRHGRLELVQPQVRKQPLRTPRSPRELAKPAGPWKGLRGGSQLVKVDGGLWLGVGHEMELVGTHKEYWHRFFLWKAGDDRCLAQGPNWKLGHDGIEFVAGLAYDGERLCMSFGVDDCEAWLATLDLADVMKPLAVRS
jgi:hypothetical protein